MRPPPSPAAPRVIRDRLDGRMGRRARTRLDLRRVQVHRDDVVRARDHEHVGDELGRDRRTALVLQGSRGTHATRRPFVSGSEVMRERARSPPTAVPSYPGVRRGSTG